MKPDYRRDLIRRRCLIDTQFLSLDIVKVDFIRFCD